MDKLAAGDATLPEAQYAASMLWNRAENGAKSALAAAERAIACDPVTRRPNSRRPRTDLDGPE